MEATAKGQNVRHEKKPARRNLIVPTVATMMLRVSAVGLISAGGVLNNAIAAR